MRLPWTNREEEDRKWSAHRGPPVHLPKTHLKSKCSSRDPAARFKDLESLVIMLWMMHDEHSDNDNDDDKDNIVIMQTSPNKTIFLSIDTGRKSKLKLH